MTLSRFAQNGNLRDKVETAGELREGFHQAASGLSDSATTVLRASEVVLVEVSDVLASMQYHDRVAQVFKRETRAARTLVG